MVKISDMIKRSAGMTDKMSRGAGTYKEPRTQFADAGSSRGETSSTGKSKLHFWSPGGGRD